MPRSPLPGDEPCLVCALSFERCRAQCYQDTGWAPVCADLTLTYGSPSVTVTNRTLLSSSCEFSCFASAYASGQGGLGSANMLGSPTLDPGCEGLWKEEQYARLYARAATQSTARLVNVSSAPPWLGAYFKPGTAGWPITTVLPVNAKAQAADAKAREAFQVCEAPCGGEFINQGTRRVKPRD